MTIAEQLERKGEIRGELKTAREDIVGVLEARFGRIPESLKEKLAAINDRAVLKDLLLKAVTTASVAELEELL
jgi:hypothetical protein